MNKAELVAAVAAKADISKKQAEECLNALIEAVEKEVSKGEEVTLVGFGTFGVAKRKARTGRNPQTGAEIKIPAKKVPRFVPGKAFKALVAGKK
ncbi:MAG: HU family DNA-binding protein [bacterium]|nr:HU family DNA-binding protein [bacterium]